MEHDTLHVTLRFKQTDIPVGRLAYINKKIIFEFFPDFIVNNLQISPFKLPLKNGLMTCDTHVFEGLFGVFNDSLPDGWGRLLLDRKLMKLGIEPHSITPLDRLKYVGKRGMGALRYLPEFPEKESFLSNIDLDVLSEEAYQFQENDQEQYIDDLLVMNGSSAGARPKILVSIDPKSSNLVMTDNSSYLHNDWIVKFKSSLDPKDSGPIEYAYHQMAKSAGVIVPEARLFKSRDAFGYFGVKRFDRTDNSSLHVHTLSGLLHADHRLPSVDYETIMKATLILTKNSIEVEKQFTHAVFNVLSHNRDDHSKNFSFLMNEKGSWSVSDAYDLTFSMGPAGEHCTTVMGNGLNPGKKELLKLARISNITEKKALTIIEKVQDAVSRWDEFARASNVSSQSLNHIQKYLKNRRS
jgi:serine/threonine-protein kinase HipA